MQWPSNAATLSARSGAALRPFFRALSQPGALRRWRQLALLLLLVWGAFALARLAWALLPRQADTPPPVRVINPVDSRAPVAAATELNLERMRAWHLFGEAGAAGEPLQQQVVVPSSPRAGIEDNARETSLNLTLRGVLASSDEGLGHAIVEYRGRQAVYAVDDKLPSPGRVLLAKVLPGQVILDNGGTYERLTLFAESSLGGASAGSALPASATRDDRQIDKRAEAQTTALAADYRARLYRDPQSLAEVVTVSAVRREGELLGYRIAPGRDQQQFEQLGFKAGDLVTGVNGIALDNPASTMRLYNAMRSAQEVVFDLQRGGQPLTLAVSLGPGSG